MLAPRTRFVIAGGATSIVLAAALACGPSSNLNSSDMVKVHGTAQDPTGAPQGSTQVNLVRIPDVLEALTTGVVLVGSLGTECLASNPPPICSTFRHTTSAADGTYQFMLMGSDTQGSLGQAVTWYLEYSGAIPAGKSTAPTTGGTFVINTTDLQLPTLRLWNPTATSQYAGLYYSFTWSTLQNDANADASSYTVKFAAGSDVPYWLSSAGTETTATWDPQTVEDVRGNWWVEASRRVSAAQTDVNITYRGAGATLASPSTLQPRSRGKSCQVQRDGAAAPLGSGACVLTDGTMATSYSAAGARCTPPDGGTCNQTNDNWVQVDLGAASGIARIYVRNYSGAAFTLEGSADGTNFATLATPTSDNGYYEVAMPAAVSARYVRIRATDPTQQLGSFNEFSVF